jgi:hypothetical protein
MWLGVRKHMPPREILAVVSIQPNSEALVVCVVLAHPRATFHPCTCELYKCVVAVTATLIGYDDVKVAAERRPQEGENRDRLLSLR